MRYLIGITILAATLGLVGCGKYHGAYGGKYYMNDARTVPPLHVPAGINSPVTQQYFTVPNAQLGHATPKLSLLPPDPEFRARLAEHNSKKIHQHER
jgi:uncharacterized lipoprotein